MKQVTREEIHIAEHTLLNAKQQLVLSIAHKKAIKSGVPKSDIPGFISPNKAKKLIKKAKAHLTYLCRCRCENKNNNNIAT